MAQAEIYIDGMDCGGCVRSVTAALVRRPGVTKADVSLEEAKATIDYDPETVTEDELREAVEAAGYVPVKG